MILAAILAATAIAIVQASFFEWFFHRNWLHRPWRPEGCFTAHTLVHHQLLKAGETFHVTEPEQEEALTFQWWGGPVLILINMAPWALLAWAFGAAHIALPSAVFLITFGAIFSVYYIGYEGLHYLMHKPSIAVIENSAFFKFLKKHHAIHHARMNKNLNVFLPIADFCLGTLVLEMPSTAIDAGNVRGKQTARRHSRFGQRLRAGAEDTQREKSVR